MVSLTTMTLSRILIMINTVLHFLVSASFQTHLPLVLPCSLPSPRDGLLFVPLTRQAHSSLKDLVLAVFSAWNNLLSDSDLEWIQIHSDAISLEGPSLTSVKRNPVTLYHMNFFLFSSEHLLLSEIT